MQETTQSHRTQMNTELEEFQTMPTQVLVQSLGLIQKYGVSAEITELQEESKSHCDPREEHQHN
jgi:hypothetical protein